MQKVFEFVRQVPVFLGPALISLVLFVVACGSTTPGPTTGIPPFTPTTTIPTVIPFPSPSPVATQPQPTPLPALHVSKVSLSIIPTSVQGIACGTTVTFNYTATFYLNDSAGGTIKFLYTDNDGRASSSGVVGVVSGQTVATFSWQKTYPLPPDHTEPGFAEVIVASPNAINSPQVRVDGMCTVNG